MRRIGLPLDHVSTTLDIRAVLNAALTARPRPTLWALRWSIRPRRRHLVVDGAHSRAFDVGQTAAPISPTGWHRPGRVIRRRSCRCAEYASACSRNRAGAFPCARLRWARRRRTPRRRWRHRHPRLRPATSPGPASIAPSMDRVTTWVRDCVRSAPRARELSSPLLPRPPRL